MGLLGRYARVPGVQPHRGMAQVRTRERHDDRGGPKKKPIRSLPCAALLLAKRSMKTIADRLGDVVEEAAFPELHHRFHRHSGREMDVG